MLTNVESDSLHVMWLDKAMVCYWFRFEVSWNLAWVSHMQAYVPLEEKIYIYIERHWCYVHCLHNCGDGMFFRQERKKKDVLRLMMLCVVPSKP